MTQHSNLQIKEIICPKSITKTHLICFMYESILKLQNPYARLNILKNHETSKFNWRSFSCITLKSIMAIQFGQFKTNIIQINTIKICLACQFGKRDFTSNLHKFKANKLKPNLLGTQLESFCKNQHFQSLFSILIG